MSDVFEQAGTEQQPEETQQQDNALETQESYVQKLVEARGEKWQDPEVIAKGKFEADNHIQELERQLEELRGDLSKNEYAKQLLETLQGKAEAPTSSKSADAQQEKDQGSAAEQDTTGEAGDLESLVEETLRKREQKQTAQQNLSQVNDTLTEAYGTEASKVVKERAQELGMSLDRLQEIAAESPSAFLRLVGESPAVEKNPTTSSSVNTTAAFNRSGERNWNYYQDLRRSNPKQYYSPKIQNQLAQDRVNLGDRFYSN